MSIVPTEIQTPRRNQTCCEGVNIAIARFFEETGEGLFFFGDVTPEEQILILDFVEDFRRRLINLLNQSANNLLKCACNNECCGEAATAIAHILINAFNRMLQIVGSAGAFGILFSIPELFERSEAVFARAKRNIHRVFATLSKNDCKTNPDCQKTISCQ